MCYDKDAVPPDLPVAGESVSGEDLVLAAADGNLFSVYVAQPQKEFHSQVLIFPDVRGLHQFYKELAVRFAQAGVRALAIDYFGRTAGVRIEEENFNHEPHVRQLQMNTFFQDVTGALSYLHSTNAASVPTFTIGFCLGGSFSLLAGTQDFALSGVIAFYASLSRSLPTSKGSVLEQAKLIKYPVLGLFGGADHGIPVSEVQQLGDELNQAEIKNTIVVYPDAPHSFFDRRATQYAEASADAWKQILNFMSSYS
ncbi:dienelactone hydrolase family protein [Tengunoibacter tsumagoiensis]|uniref:Carboxymethylenebutenolidase n=1 Tax=Tengunoibacter tsumagoiensis TaxID=2014871 RepID=A0A402A756_9CHLR|nr:dienelactone hydrolase family protein [Tengunoibacter tsumagoiensis]GCE14929.1 carboxymethylenebutenolidase [Tengunoibacter tsumagoiensis]